MSGITTLKNTVCGGAPREAPARIRVRSKLVSVAVTVMTTKGVASAVGLQLHALAYNFANFMRTLALPEAVAHWSLTSLREKLVRIGAKIVSHARYVTFQMAEIAVPRDLFSDILRLIAELRPPSAAASA